MAGSDFRYVEPLYNVDPALSKYYEPAASPFFDPGTTMQSQALGIRVSGLKNKISGDFFRDSAYGAFNEMKGLPPTIRKQLKKLQNSPIGGDIANGILGDSNFQAAMGGNVGDAWSRLLANAPSFSQTGDRLDYSNLPALREQQLRTAANFGQNLRDKIYRSPEGQYTLAGFRGKSDGKGGWQPGKEGTYGLKPEDAINAATYQAQFGGELSRATESKPGAKMAAVGKTWEAASKVMEVLGTKTFEDTVRAFKALEGKDFGMVDPEQIKRKFDKIGKMANAAGMAPGAMASMMSESTQTMGAYMGMGPGTGYTFGGNLDGYAEEHMKRAMARANKEGTNSKEVIDKYNKEETERTGLDSQTEGGRAIELATLKLASGQLTPGNEAVVQDMLKRWKAGDDIGKDMDRAQIAMGMDVRSTVQSEAAMNSTREILGMELEAEGGSAAVEAAKADVVKNMRERSVVEAAALRAKASADTGEGIIRKVKEQIGFKGWSKDEEKDIDDAAYADLETRIKNDEEMTAVDKEAASREIAAARSAGKTMDRFTSDQIRTGSPSLRRLGNLGRSSKTLAETMALQVSGKLGDKDGVLAVNDMLEMAAKILPDKEMTGTIDEITDKFKRKSAYLDSTKRDDLSPEDKILKDQLDAAMAGRTAIKSEDVLDSVRDAYGDYDTDTTKGKESETVTVGVGWGPNKRKQKTSIQTTNELRADEGQSKTGIPSEPLMKDLKGDDKSNRFKALKEKAEQRQREVDSERLIKEYDERAAAIKAGPVNSQREWKLEDNAKKTADKLKKIGMDSSAETLLARSGSESEAVKDTAESGGGGVKSGKDVAASGKGGMPTTLIIKGMIDGTGHINGTGTFDNGATENG